MLAWINNQRAAHGLQPLTLNTCLGGFSQQRAVALPDDFSHHSTTPIWQSCSFNFVSENIAADFSVAGADEAWRNSPGHWQNILDPNISQIGIGIYVTSWGGLYACTDFGGFYPGSS